MKRATAAHGLIWSVIDMGGSQVLSFLTFLILARILAPEEYGTFALAASFASFAFFLVQGLTPAVVQRGSIDETHTSTAFWTSLAIGAALTAIIAASASWLAVLFHNPQLAPVLQGMSLICLPMGLASVPMGLFRRELRMSAFAVRTVAGYFVGAAVAIPMAMKGFGALALVFGQIAQWVITVLVVYAVSSWRPKFRFSIPVFVELGRYSVHYLSAMVVGLLITRVDMWILGLFLDVRSLGYYALALRLLEAVTAVTIAPVDRLVIPLLGPLRRVPAEFNATYNRLIVGVTSAWLPVVAGMGVVSAALIPIAFGPKWADSVPVVQVMCLSAFTYTLTAFTGEALSAWGRPDTFSKLQFFRLIATAVAFGAAAPFGIVAAGLAWALVPAVILPIHLIVLRGMPGADCRSLLSEWGKVAASGALMLGAVLLVRWFGPFGPWLPAAEIAMGVAVYVFLLDRVMLPGYILRLVKLGLGAVPAFAPQAKH